MLAQYHIYQMWCQQWTISHFSLICKRIHSYRCNLNKYNLTNMILENNNEMVMEKKIVLISYCEFWNTVKPGGGVGLLLDGYS